VVAAIYVVVVGSIFGLPIAFNMRKRARLRNAPTGSRQAVDVRLGGVNKAIQKWGKLGYDSHDRSEWKGPPTRTVQMPIIPVILTLLC
jgi:hypothetical protein